MSSFCSKNARGEPAFRLDSNPRERIMSILNLGMHGAGLMRASMDSENEICVKASEVLVSLVSCTIDTESVLKLRTTRTDRVSRCLLHLCNVRLVMSFTLFSVRIATSKSCMW